MIPKSGYRFPACVTPSATVCDVRLGASAGEGRSEKIMLKQQAKAKQNHSAFAMLDSAGWARLQRQRLPSYALFGIAWRCPRPSYPVAMAVLPF
jgi:hypothetical protein